MSDFDYIFLAFWAGYFVAMWIYRKPAINKIEVRVDKELSSQISGQMVEHWLESRGLVWQPKGLEQKDMIKR